MFLKSVVVSTIFSVLAYGGSLFANTQETVLVNVGPLSVTSYELEKTITSSPFGTQFNSMDEKDQALLRGNILQRLVSSRLLYLEAEQLGLANSDEFEQELESFRLGSLYKNYMDHLRTHIEISKETLDDFKQQFKGNSDALEAAKAMYRAERFRDLRDLTIRNLKEKYNARILENNINSDNLQDDTLLLTADGFEVRYRDILKNSTGKLVSNPEWVMKQVVNRGELLLVAQASKDQGIDVSEMIESFNMDNLPSLLLRFKHKEWVPNSLVLQQYYESHPEFGRTLGFWHVGQIVTSSYAQANALRNRILNGESLFKLAGQYSIDPYGREKYGDMGWVREGQGKPEIEMVLSTLKDNEISPVIKTDNGFHIVTVTERRPGQVRKFESMPDKIRQAFIAEKLGEYLKSLEKKYSVIWHITNRDEK